MKRFAALLALALAATGVFAGPAHASGITVDMLSPSNGAVARGNISVKGYASSEDGIEAMSLTVAGTNVGNMSPSDNEAYLSYVWNTVNAPQTYSPIANGDYYASMTATSKTGETATAETTILVDNAPTVPKGISASASGGSVQVSWAANPEPDISGYKVERNGSAIATVGGTSYTDNVSSGNYSYRVIAIRPSPVSGSRSSIPSSTATASVSASSSSGDSGSVGSGDSGSYSGSDSGSGSGSGTTAPNLPGGFSNVGDLGGRNGALNASAADRIGGVGLPSWGLSLPGITGLFGIPQLPSEQILEWGEYQDTLPYDLPQNAQVYTEGLGNVAARAPDRFIPPDGLRWVAAGLLLLVGASMLRFGAVRLGGEPTPITISALPSRSVPAPVIPLRPTAPRLVQTEGDRGETTEIPEENPVLNYLRARW